MDNNQNNQYPNYQPPQQPPQQPVPPPVYQQPVYVNAPAPDGKGMAIASLVLGILAVVIPYAGTACAIVGLILGIMGKKKMDEAGAPSGMAMAGIILSIIALVASIIITVVCVSACNAVTSSLPSSYYW